MDLSSIRDLIFEIDNSPGILNFQFPGDYSCWLLIRFEVYNFLLKKYVYTETISSSINLKSNFGSFKDNALERVKNLRYLAAAYKHRPKNLTAVDCLNYCSSYGSYLDNGIYKNKSTGFLSDTQDIKALNLWFVHNYRYIRNYGNNSKYFDYLFLKPHYKYFYLRIRPTQKIEIVLQEFQTHLNKYLQEYITDETLTTFLHSLRNYYCNLSDIREDVDRLLEKTSPRLFIIEDASYGGWYTAAILQGCRRHNVKTAEMQHGIFDIAYEYGEEILKNDMFARQKPDFLFTYGKYFSQYAKTSSSTVEIGSYFLDQKSKLSQTVSPYRKEKIILFIAQKQLTNAILPVLLTSLLNVDFKFRLIIRLHPSDSNKEGYSDLIEKLSPEFSIADDLYDLLRSADFVIGLHSAALFESKYFKKRTFIFSNEASRNTIPPEVGEWFSTEQELRNLFQQAPSNVPQHSSFFKENAIFNFIEFWNKNFN